MIGKAIIQVACIIAGLSSSALAIEGTTAAGPLGGNDIRSAQLPPPGVYGGTIQLYAEAHDFLDGNGHVVPALADLDLW